MNSRTILWCSLLLAFFVSLGSARPALACEPPAEDQVVEEAEIAGRCVVVRPRVVVKRTPAPIVARAVAPTPTPPKGDSPLSALEASDTWQTLAAGAIAWFRIDNGRNFKLDVWLDAYGKSGVTMAMYAPEQSNELSPATKPKGWAAPVKADPTHDLYWAGFQAMGVWYALVSNHNPFPVQYKVGIKQTDVDRNCEGYWETLSTGAYVYWVDCGNYRRK